MSLAYLLEAARIVEQRESNDTNVKYLSLGIRKDRKYAKRSQTYRATHNQLEKNRRAHLRDCLVSLRDLVPCSPDTNKVTTLSLLQSAKQYIKVLENHDIESQAVKRTLCVEQQRLRKQLSSLLNSFTNGSSVVLYKSDTSTSSNSSCEEDIDVENDDETGYGSADDSASTISGSSLNSVL
ncbi:max dimerization protein 3-like [Hydractinia symbiolongicarpus]|uniref:max dimerization protein 3-like n=1 Tax=Hydractinia symbiolongicarpus TaxID=13093 RepID=UPI00254F951D|nr:max dimerization protein 3-like [Hydractinia symbiolongicarpus]